MTDFEFNSNVLAVAGATIVLMLLGTAIRWERTRWGPPEVARLRRASLQSWWWVVLAILCAAVLGRTVAVLLFALVSGLALREFCSMRGIGSTTLVRTAYVLLTVSYLWVWLRWPVVFAAFLPAAGLVALGIAMLGSSSPKGYSAMVGQIYWGLMLTAYAPAFAVLLFALSAETNPVAGNSGWFLFLLLVTEADDICQALVGRAIGRRKIAPVISPNKTWAGLVGGIVASCLLAALLAPWLTPWSWGLAVTAGVLISLTGFWGDLNISGIKRDSGVKDSGNLLPGQGGILDRIDSLTFAAPTFYLFVLLSTVPGSGGAL